MPGPVVPKTGSQLQGPIFSDFEVKAQLIQSVDNNTTATVTTVSNHGYTTGMYVLVNVPPAYKMSILQRSYITVLSPTTFITTIDTSQMQPFTSPTYPPYAFTPAQAVPISFVEENLAPL